MDRVQALHAVSRHLLLHRKLASLIVSRASMDTNVAQGVAPITNVGAITRSQNVGRVNVSAVRKTMSAHKSIVQTTNVQTDQARASAAVSRPHRPLPLLLLANMTVSRASMDMNVVPVVAPITSAGVTIPYQSVRNMNVVTATTTINARPECAGIVSALTKAMIVLFDVATVASVIVAMKMKIVRPRFVTKGSASSVPTKVSRSALVTESSKFEPVVFLDNLSPYYVPLYMHVFGSNSTILDKINELK